MDCEPLTEAVLLCDTVSEKEPLAVSESVPVPDCELLAEEEPVDV